MKLKHNIFLGTTNDKFHLEKCSISIVNYSKPVSEDWHSHEDIHLSLILQGGNLESRQKEDVQVIPGKIMAYNEGEVHRNRFTAFPSKNLNIELKQNFFYSNELSVENLNLLENRNTQAYLDLLKIYNEIQLNDAYTYDSIELSLKSLFSVKVESTNKPVWIEQVREIVEDRWDEFISLNELSQILNVHPITISKYFKKHYGGTLGDYMRKVKVKRASHLLFQTNMSITEIAFTCGFSDHSHMIRLFKKYLGYNPKSFRKI